MKIINAKDFLSNSNNHILIDARSPKEYKKVHLKKALNFFALNDKEHEEVGTKYAHNKYDGKINGARYICKNTSIHLKKIAKTFNPHKDEIYIYCARGGQRSGAVGHILSEIGFNVYKCEGGFKDIRNYVLEYLNNYTNHNFVSLAGSTACGKTRLLKILDNSIDLEKMAHHLGSTFGSRGFVQPSQQQFDMDLFYSLKKLENKDYIFVEAESKNIGNITLCNNFYSQINSGKKILCTASIETRINNCIDDYKNIKPCFFYSCLERLKPYLGNEKCELLNKYYKENNLYDLVKILLLDYYDKVYKMPKTYDLELNLDDIYRAKKDLLSYLEQ